MGSSVGMNVIRAVFATIDKAVYGLITILYNLLSQLASINVFNPDNIQEFSTRIYAFVGILMLFKVTFSLIEYLVNPDSMSDKTKGTGNLAKNVIITLFLIIIVPFGFDLLYSAQSAILKDNLIPRLILGTTNDSVEDMKILMDEKQCVRTDENGNIADTFSYIESNGDYIALMTFRPFFQIYDGKTLDDTTRNIFCSAKNINSLLTENIYNAKKSGEYIVDYSFFMSTASGILVMLLLLEFCFDVAMRNIKLGFLEIFAPVAIISYIDPKSSQNGMFKKWLKEVFGTWARLFIRLAILYFVVYILKILNENQMDYTENGMWVMLFFIIGALLFAKKAVPLIEDLLGVKMDHSIQLNPFKKIKDQAVGGKTLTAMPGKALATATGLTVAAGGAIVGHKLKTQEMRDSQRNLRTEERRLNQLKNDLQIKTARFKQVKDNDSINPIYKNKIKVDALEARRAVNNQQVLVDKAKSYYDKSVLSYKEKNSNKDKEGNQIPYFSAEHPIVSATMQAIRGAKLGLNAKDTEQFAKAIVAGVNAAKAAAKRTNDFDKFGYVDRMRDLATDITGVKNASGTTSIVKQEIKQQTENLNDIRNMIASIEHQFGNLKPGILNYQYDENEKTTDIKINANYQNFDPGEKEAIQHLINQYSELRTAEKNVTKSIKEYEDVLSINAKKPLK